VTILQFILPILVGVSLGLVGGGGTILAVPILIYIFHQEPKSAIGMSLGIVSLVSLGGSITHWKKGNIRLENAAFFAPFAMLGAFIGAKLAGLPFITSYIQLVLFSCTVLVSSLAMILFNPKEKVVNHKTIDQIQITWIELINFAIVGILVGLLTGLVGVGGGFLIVPALIYLARIPIHQAIGTSLVVIFFNSISGFLGYLGKVKMDWIIMLSFFLLSSAGVVVGSHLTQYIPKKYLQKFFGIFLFLMGAWILWQEIGQ
jgi:uncharacterized membrane protein YfcA